MNEQHVVRTTEKVAPCSKDDPNADHDWERDEYDPSVGMMSNGRTCVSCGRFEFVDYEGYDDDYV